MWPWRRRPSIPDALWANTLQRPCLHGLPPDIEQRLRERVSEFIGCKTFEGAAGLTITDAMALDIAAQACLPVLQLGLAPYDNWSEIVVYPSGFRVPRRLTDAAGVVHEFEDELAGEAWPQGSLILSWDEVRSKPHGSGNLVIHEFAHALDMANGEADGYPLGLQARDLELWDRGFEQAWNELLDEVEAIEDSLPPDLDPESPEGIRRFAHLVLDPYALTDEAEFLAVSTEAYFCKPQALKARWPLWYQALSAWLRLDWAAIRPLP